MNQPLQFSEIEIERALDCAAAECGMVPTPSQHLAAKQVLTSTITKISGIAGTGRTQTFRLLSVAWKILTAGSSDILLLACTPKAASCLGQIVGIEAITLHQALGIRRSEEHTSELQSLMRISYAVFCLKKKNIK